MQRLAAVVAVTLALCASAWAVSPAVGIARAVKSSIQAYYPTLKFGKVTCSISAGRTSAICLAHFTAPAKQAVGVFTIKVTETAAGQAVTKTLAVSCKDAKTGAKLKCV